MTTNGSTAVAAKSVLDSERITIPAPNFITQGFLIRGTAPYVQCRFPEKAQAQIRMNQAAGSTARKGTKREAKDFDAMFEAAQHVSTEGWCGIPAPAFRNAMISACRTVGFTMTRAKLAVFIEADGFDRVDSTPLVRITRGSPEKHEMMGRNSTGVVDLRVRAAWQPGWESLVRVRYDADIFTSADVANLLMRAGAQVGIGDGRPDSRQSAGQGWGLFELADAKPTE